MPVVQVVDQRQSNWQGTQDSSRTYRFTRKFLVETNSVNDGPKVVLSHEYIPKIGDIYDVGYDRLDEAKCISRSATCSESPFIWLVDCEFSSNPNEADVGTADSPLTAPVQISYDKSKFTKVVDKARFIPFDEDGNLKSYEEGLDNQAVSNSAGDAFDPQPEIDDSRPIIVMVKNFPTFAPSILLDYRDVINSDEFFGCPPRTVKLSGINVTKEFGPFEYFRATFEFELDPNEWCLRILDQGLRQLADGDKKRRVAIKEDTESGEETGDPVTSPVLLDGKGRKARSTVASGIITPKFRVYYPYKQKPFSALGLGV